MFAVLSDVGQKMSASMVKFTVIWADFPGRFYAQSFVITYRVRSMNFNSTNFSTRFVNFSGNSVVSIGVQIPSISILNAINAFTSQNQRRSKNAAL